MSESHTTSTAVPNHFGLIPHLTLIPPPQSPPSTRIPHTFRRHKITTFNILLCVASVMTVKPVIARLGDRLKISGFGKMRCMLLSGEMNGRVCEIHHSPLQPAYSPQGNPPGWKPLHQQIPGLWSRRISKDFDSDSQVPENVDSDFNFDSASTPA